MDGTQFAAKGCSHFALRQPHCLQAYVRRAISSSSERNRFPSPFIVSAL